MKSLPETVNMCLLIAIIRQRTVVGKKTEIVAVSLVQDSVIIQQCNYTQKVLTELQNVK